MGRKIFGLFVKKYSKTLALLKKKGYNIKSIEINRRVGANPTLNYYKEIEYSKVN